jgi:hypothetical protein
MMMQPTDLGDFPDWANLWPLDRPRHGTIHGQRPVRAPVMVIADVCRQEPPQMSLIQDHHVIQALATDAANEPFHEGILPWALWGDEDLFVPQVPHPLAKQSVVDAVSIAQQIPRRLVPWEGVDDLLCGSLSGGMCRHIEVDDATSIVGQDDEDKEHLACHRRHDKDIEGDQILHMVVKESLPCRRGRLASSDAIRLHG